MPDLILGPAGVLPPGEWAVGARVSRGGILSAVWDNAWVEVNYPHAAETQNDLLLELRLFDQEHIGSGRIVRSQHSRGPHL